MKDKKNIDRLFQERFKDFETPPPRAAWDAIEERLEGRKPRRIAPFWWRLGGIAAALVILFLLANYFGKDTHLNPITIDVPIAEESVEPENNSIDPKITKDKAPEASTTEVAQEKTSKPVTGKSKAEEIEDFYTNSKENNEQRVLEQKFFTPSTLENSESTVVSNNSSETTSRNNYPSNSQDNNVVGSSPRIEDSEKFKKAVVDQSSSEVLDPLTTLNPARVDAESISTLTESAIENALAAVDETQNKIPSLEDIARNEQEKDSVQKPAFNKAWVVSSQVGPVFTNTFGGSSVNGSVQNNNMSTELNLSYGLGVTYTISPKLSLRAGLNQVNLSYGTEDINYAFDSGFAARGTTNIPTSYSSNAVTNSNAPTPSNDSFATGFAANEILNPNSFKGIDGTLSQQLGYLEIPVEIKYELLGSNQGLSLHVLGGLSALFLTDNQVTVQNADQQLELGSDDNFNDFNQSANFGLGLGYQFTSHLGAFVEPTFKYQLNALKNNTADFQPYTLGVQTGISFKF